MNKKINVFIYTTGLVCLFIAFFLKGYLFLDPDFGWHIGIGRYILEYGIPETDPFSYTMPSYPFIDHEWLTNILIAKSYPMISQAGLALIFAFLTLLSLLISIPTKAARWSTIPVLLGTGVLLTMAGIRLQVETWFLTAILLKIILNEMLWKKYRFFLPLLFILWVNLHGGFAYGISILAFVLFLRFWLKKSIDLHDAAVFILCLLATFINPYGHGIWTEVWMQFTDGELRWSIQEWLPILFNMDPAFVAFFPLAVIMLIKYYRKFSLPELGLFIGLGISGILSHRHIALWVLLAVPVVSLGFKYFYNGLKKDPLSQKRFFLVYKLFIAGALGVILLQTSLIIISSRSWSEESYYPQKAILFLKDYPQNGQILAPYGWGGYLIWKYPEKKVFIDGRMPSFRREDAPENESTWAFKDFKIIFNEKGAEEKIFSKYNIKTILWQTPPPKENKNMIGKFLESFQQQLIEKLFKINRPEPFFDRLKALGFKEIYKDQTAVIYQKSD